MYMKHILFVCQYVKPLWSYVFPIDGGQQNLGFPTNFLGWGESLESSFKAWLHTKLVCKVRGDPLRNGWDALYRNLGPK